MYCITDVLALNGIFDISRILRLIAKAWHPQDVVGATVADAVNDGLEELGASLCMCIVGRSDGTVSTQNVNGLVGKLEHHTGIIAQFLVRCHHSPDGEQILLVFPSNEYILRTYARRTHHNV